MSTREKLNMTENENLKPASRTGVGEDRIDYLPNGDKVKWVQDEDEDGKATEWAMLLRRNDNDMVKAYHEFREQAWWQQYQGFRQRVKTRAESVTEKLKPVIDWAKKEAIRIEKKYGKKNLKWNDSELGLLHGKMSALAWVLGSEWEDALDTYPPDSPACLGTWSLI